MNKPSQGPVLLYDGACALCNGFVRLLLRNDPRARLRFAPLQSGPARAYLASQGLPTQDLNSLVFVPDWENPTAGGYLLRTSGALAALGELGGPWRVVAWLRIVPPFLRDPVYKLVARVRFALFGEYRRAPLAHPDWERRFIAR